MKLEVQNENYCATIVRVHSLVDLPGLDNLKGVQFFGFSSLVSKDTSVGGLAVLFTAETQLADAYCKHNNLYRDGTKNSDTEKTGYIEDNRRIRAVKLRKHVSSALLMPLESLACFEGVDTNLLKEGDTFTHINGVEVCTKYVIKTFQKTGTHQKSPKFKEGPRIDTKLLPEHIDTSHYLRNERLIVGNCDIVVTQKLHGTSGRFAHQICRRKLGFFERVLKRLGFNINDKTYDYFAASRRVIKDTSSDTNFQHYYKKDIWNEVLDEIKHLIPKNYVLYGEIVGYIGDSEIQKNYSYECEPGQHKLYIYRVSVVNPDGVSVDLSWDAVKEFCQVTGLSYTPEVWRGKKSDFDVDKYMDVCYAKDLGLLQCVKLAKNSPCDEGVIVRTEGMMPNFYKVKSPVFIAHETKQLDKGNVDVESQES